MGKTGCVAAHKIPPGGCFIKRTGTFAYMRMSEWALKHLGVDPHGEVIGVSYNGNVTRVKPGTLVRPGNRPSGSCVRISEEPRGIEMAKRFVSAFSSGQAKIWKSPGLLPSQCPSMAAILIG